MLHYFMDNVCSMLTLNLHRCVSRGNLSNLMGQMKVMWVAWLYITWTVHTYKYVCEPSVTLSRLRRQFNTSWRINFVSGQCFLRCCVWLMIINKPLNEIWWNFYTFYNLINCTAYQTFIRFPWVKNPGMDLLVCSYIA